jgi:hypothetical protein
MQGLLEIYPNFGVLDYCLFCPPLSLLFCSPLHVRERKRGERRREKKRGTEQTVIYKYSKIGSMSNRKMREERKKEKRET